MKPDKQVKKEFLETAKQDPDAYYATEVLKGNGFMRKLCPTCEKYFWTVHEDQDKCGDSTCQGKVTIFEDNPSKQALSFADVWNTFAEHMGERGYAKIDRYPVVARWNPTMDFTIASIAAFQPYVVSGEVEPPAKKLVIPQFCLRFGDVDNVGITGSHCTGFIMIGQKQFVPPSDWDQNTAFEDLYSYLTDVMGLPKEELTLHEDAWAGGGNFGPCMEFFSRGVELCNQVYMMFEQSHEGNRELKLKVLDMGLGMGRIAWFTQGAHTQYDAIMPTTLEHIRKITGVEIDHGLYKKFAPYSTLLNIDEVDDIQAAWKTVSEKVGVSVDELRSAIEPAKAMYSIAEHARALLFALSDGALPGNVGGYYNLRVIFRRAQDFIEEFSWDLTLADVAKWHAEELKELFPDLLANIEDVQKLLTIELQKYQENKKRSLSTIKQVLQKEVSTEKLLELYDSKGISPELVRQEAKREGKAIEIPDNFFHLVSERHEQQEAKAQTRLDQQYSINAPETQPLYYKSYDLPSAKAVVLAIEEWDMPEHGQVYAVALDRTVFYPTSGGQQHDTGTINDQHIVDVRKLGKVVVHIMKEKPRFTIKDEVELMIDLDRRIQLAQHHTAAHVINGAARQILGNHIWQAGAAKTPEKGRLDITHFEALSDEDMKKIEAVANDIVNQSLPVHQEEMNKAVAESQHGFRLYQGGAVPGDRIRVIDIANFDTEACGGTHVKTTADIQLIKLLKSTKVQDGVVRIEFVAGNAARQFQTKRLELLQQSMNALGIDDPKLLPARTKELFKNWKKIKKLKKKSQDVDPQLRTLSSTETTDGDALALASAAVQVQEEHLPKTLERFLKEC